MPTPAKDVVASSGRVLSTIFVPVERSVLKALTCLDLTDSQQPNDGYVEIGIMSGETSPQNKVAVLSSGYTGRALAVSWTGYIITEATMNLYAHIYSSTGGAFRLVALVNPYKIGAEGGILLDP